MPAMTSAMRGCRICVEKPRGIPLPHAPRPIFQVAAGVRLVIASQAPGIRAHTSGIPFQDPSGVRLRHWMALDEARFYDPSRVAILPMGFCFPGHDDSKGDLPPRLECRAAWHDEVFAALLATETVLAIGLHAIRYHAPRLGIARPAGQGLGETVADWRRYFERPAPRMLPLPHPSWRNSHWLKRNPWFESDLLPVLRAEVQLLVRQPAEPASNRRGLESIAEGEGRGEAVLGLGGRRRERGCGADQVEP